MTKRTIHAKYRLSDEIAAHNNMIKCTSCDYNNRLYMDKYLITVTTEISSGHAILCDELLNNEPKVINSIDMIDYADIYNSLSSSKCPKCNSDAILIDGDMIAIINYINSMRLYSTKFSCVGTKDEDPYVWISVNEYAFDIDMIESAVRETLIDSYNMRTINPPEITNKFISSNHVIVLDPIDGDGTCLRISVADDHFVIYSEGTHDALNVLMPFIEELAEIIYLNACSDFYSKAKITNNPYIPPKSEEDEVSDNVYNAYDHRNALFAMICNASDKSWKSRKHHDGTMFDDMFIAGLETDDGPLTYHCYSRDWPMFNCEELENAPEWKDEYTGDDVYNRIKQSIYESNYERIYNNTP